MQEARPSSDRPAAIIRDASLMGCLIAACSALLLLSNPHFFWNDDHQLAFLPAFEEISRAWRAREWPLLTESSWVCGNLAGEYQYGTFSVFINACIVVIWSLGLSLPAKAAAFSIAHQAVLAAGSFTLARSRGITRPLATLVAVVACFNGWNICWAATNWIAALNAFAWLPWAWWAMDRTVALPHARWPVAVTAVFLYLVLTAGWPFTVLMLLVITAWIAAQQFAGGLRGKSLARLGLRLGTSWLLAGLLALPALWSLVVYMDGSQRAGEAQNLQWTWVVPAAALPGLAVPTVATVWETFFQAQQHVGLELAGALVPLAILLAGCMDRRGRVGRNVMWLLGLAGFGLLAAMLPSMGVFRWSFRWLPLFHLALALAAADLASRRLPRLTAGVAAGLVAAGGAWLLASGGSLPNYDWHAAELGVIVLAWAADAFLLKRFAWRPGRAVAAWLPAVVAAGSLMALFLRVPPNLAVPVAPLGENLLATAPLEENRLYLSAYFFDDIPTRPTGDRRTFGAALRPGNTAMFAGVQTVNGYSPIHAAGIARMLPFETHGILFPQGWAWILQHALKAGEVFDILGVDGVFVSRAAAELGLPPADEWAKVWSGREGDVYHRKQAALQAASLISPATKPGERPEKLPLSLHRRHRLEATLPAGTGPRLLVFPRPWHPGWQATLDGRPLEVVAFKNVALAVPLPPGAAGRLALAYRPRAVVYGGPIAVATLIGLLGWLVGFRQPRRQLLPGTAPLKTAALD